MSYNNKWFVTWNSYNNKFQKLEFRSGMWSFSDINSCQILDRLEVGNRASLVVLSIKLFFYFHLLRLIKISGSITFLILWCNSLLISMGWITYMFSLNWPLWNCHLRNGVLLFYLLQYSMKLSLGMVFENTDLTLVLIIFS